ncbi:site-specific integrase [Kistimonas scapharcae]|uniref:Site-specific integrase n=1 Tax=Kistimonas scapharcae TaxID=1036133 RepID=A0ABP8VA14_9GAMM
MLTDKEIRNLKPKAAEYLVSDDTSRRGVGRLKLRVRPNGVKEFYFFYSFSGKKKIKLGNYRSGRKESGITLESARKKAEEFGVLLRDGIDPQQWLDGQRREQEDQRRERERQALLESQNGTLADLLASYIGWMKANNRRSISNVEQSLDCYVARPFPRMMDKLARDITVTDIRDIIAQMIRKGVTTQSNRVRSMLHAAFQHGLYQDNNPLTYLDKSVTFGLSFNPVSGIPKQTQWERVGERALSETEVHYFWNDMPGCYKSRKNVRSGGAMSHVMMYYFKLFLALAGQRSMEVLRLQWDWIDRKDSLLVIPAASTKTGGKTGRDHVIPLSDLSLQILDQLAPITGHCRHLFAGGQGGGLMTDNHMSDSAAACSLRKFIPIYGKNHDDPANPFYEQFTPRDLRRTCKTLMGDAGISKEIRDRLQNHTISDISSRHYDRYDYIREKRVGMAIWTEYLRWVIDGAGEASKPTPKVVNLR